MDNHDAIHAGLLRLGEHLQAAQAEHEALLALCPAPEDDGHEHPEEPPAETWDVVLTGPQPVGDVVVPEGERWLIGAGVEVEGNVVVDGVLAMRPGSSLKFIGANPDEYVGGGRHYGPEFARDIGLWVGHMGQLDIRGTPKAGWNRTGSDPSWGPDDELWIAPTAVGDYTPRRWYPGDPIPRVPVPAGAKLPEGFPPEWLVGGIPAEIMNVTRDVVIEGPGHIHICAHMPQRVEYVTLRGMGVAREGGSVEGRYALHHHWGQDGSRGSIWRGVAAVGSLGRVFVPHASHGITIEDCVSVESYGEAMWWDDGHLTDDLLIDRLCVSGVHMPRAVSGKTSYISAVALQAGHNMVIRNSAASGARGSKLSNGYDWPEPAGKTLAAVWGFDEGNVAHNNQGAGLRFWTNYAAPHVVRRSLTYRNVEGGIETGAYINSVRYEDTLCVDDMLRHHSTSKPMEGTGLPAGYERVQVYARQGPAVRIERLTLPAQSATEWIDCTLIPGPGSPVVEVGSAQTLNPFRAIFRRSGVTPEDFAWPEPMPGTLEGSEVTIEHEDGRAWRMTVSGGVVQAQALA